MGGKEKNSVSSVIVGLLLARSGRALAAWDFSEADLLMEPDGRPANFYRLYHPFTSFRNPTKVKAMVAL